MDRKDQIKAEVKDVLLRLEARGLVKITGHDPETQEPRYALTELGKKAFGQEQDMIDKARWN